MSKGFIFIEKRTKKHYFYNDFIEHIRYLFADFTGPEGSVYDIFLKWFDKKK